MDSKINTVGILWIILGVLTLISSAFVTISGGAFLAGMKGASPSDAAPGAVMAGFMGIIGVCLMLFGAVEVIAGVSLRKHRSWARIVIIILSILNLFAFPLGTIVGIYSLVVLLSAEAKPVFAGT